MSDRETSEPVLVRPIGRVCNDRAEIHDDFWGAVESVIALDPAQFGPEALAGLADFSHLEVVFLMHLVPDAKVVRGARAPRNRVDLPPVGIFAQRAKGRPNRLAVSRCELLRVDGLRVHVRALDAVDGSPVLDLKPWLAEFGPRGPVRQPPWAGEIMSEYYLDAPADPPDPRD